MNEEPVEVKISDEVQKFLDASKPAVSRKLGREVPTSKHANGRRKPLNQDRARRAANKADKSFQARLSQEVDKRSLGNG
jgi:hypothetical protein